MHLEWGSAGASRVGVCWLVHLELGSAGGGLRVQLEWESGASRVGVCWCI